MLTRGHLHDASEAPAQGERFEQLVSVRGVIIEHILSGKMNPTTYHQTEDEWVVVLSGRATLEVDGERCRLGAGDWVLLPAGVPHTVAHTDPGTSWLTVHVPLVETPDPR